MDTYPAAAAARPHAVSTVATQVGTGTITYEGYGYDGAGNTTTRPGQVLEYNALGQLKKTTIGSTTQKNVYDADGNLLLRTDSSSGNTLYLAMTELRTAASSTVVAGTRTYSAAGIPVAERTTQAGVTGSILRWLTTDLVGTSQVEIQNTTGLQTRRYTDPYGKPKGTVPSWSSDHGYLNAPTSTTTGLTHLGAREYDPSLGRFTSVDAVLAPGNPQQNNGYSYAGNNPVTRSDPTGECYTAGDHYYAGSCVDSTSPEKDTNDGSDPPSAPGNQGLCGGTLSYNQQLCGASPGIKEVSSPSCDPRRQNCSDAVSLGLEWLTGLGPRTQYFTNGDPMLEELSNHREVQGVKKEMLARLTKPNPDLTGGVSYSLGGLDGVGNFFGDYSDLLSGKSAVAFLGSYSGTVVVTNVTEGSATLNWHIDNTSDLASATHPPFYGTINDGCGGCMDRWGEFVNSLPGDSGPLSPTHQVFTWTERVTF